jgi:hypothetical protein
MTPTEAIYGFAAWLTCHPEGITVGASHEAGVVAQRCKEWCEANNLPDVTDAYPKNIVHPATRSNPDDRLDVEAGLEVLHDYERAHGRMD